MAILVDVAGWLGAALLVLAYGLVSSGRVDSRSAAYQGLNLLGAVGVLVNSGWNGAFPSVAINLVWIAIGLVALARRQSVTN